MADSASTVRMGGWLDELIKQSPTLAVCFSKPTSPAPQQAAEHADYQWERIMGPIRTTGSVTKLSHMLSASWMTSY